MKRWIGKESKYGESPEIDAFLNEVVAVCRKHGFSISHEDRHGGFEIKPFADEYAGWLMAASDETYDQAQARAAGTSRGAHCSARADGDSDATGES